jgi:ABC-2 type transport system ATP-binding protein
MFDDIVEFAELGQFIDNQVKFYSSGMYIRLGFAVAVNVDPDVLVIDEVLAVGDERFQRKCLERIKLFQREGRTILFVSHSPDQVRAICDRAVVLADGGMIGLGPPGEAVRIFREALLEAGDVLALGIETPPVEDGSEPIVVSTAPEPAVSADDSRPIRLTDMEVSYVGQEDHQYLRSGSPLVVRVGMESSRAVASVVIQIELVASDGTLLLHNDSDAMGVPCAVSRGPNAFDFRFDTIPFGDGVYGFNVGVLTQDGLSDFREPAGSFEVMNPGKSTGIFVLPTSLSPVATVDLAFDPVVS